MQNVDSNNQESDLEAEKELWYELEEKEENGEMLTKIEKDQLAKIRDKYDFKLVTEEKPDPIVKNEIRNVTFDCQNERFFKNQCIN